MVAASRVGGQTQTSAVPDCVNPPGHVSVQMSVTAGKQSVHTTPPDVVDGFGYAGNVVLPLGLVY